MATLPFGSAVKSIKKYVLLDPDKLMGEVPTTIPEHVTVITDAVVFFTSSVSSPPFLTFDSANKTESPAST